MRTTAMVFTRTMTAVVGIMLVQGVAYASGPLLGALAAGFEPAASAGLSARSQGYLGVDIRDIGDEQVAALKLKESRGAEVIHVDHDGPAGKAGLREHDVILQMNGQVIEGEDQLRRILRETPAGRTVNMLISRDGQQQTLTTQLANREELEREAWQNRWHVPEPEGQGGGPSGPTGNVSTGGSSARETFVPAPSVITRGHNFIGTLTTPSGYTGATVQVLGPQLAEFFGTPGVGVLVQSVDGNSPAALAGLRAGDVVIRANSTTMTSVSDWAKVVRDNKGKNVAVVVLRDKKEQTLTLVPDRKKRSSVEPTGLDRSDPIVVASRLGFSWR